MRPRDAREQVLDQPPYLVPKPPIELPIGVQRVCVILPVEEQVSEASPTISEDEHSATLSLETSADEVKEEVTDVLHEHFEDVFDEHSEQVIDEFYSEDDAAVKNS